MARPGVTYVEVSAIAQQLVAAGRAPTIETIRHALGTGSNSTLGAHLRTWKSTQNESQQIATKENIPEELISALKGVWDRVMNQSEDKILATQQETQQERMQLKQVIEQLQKDNAHWQQQYQQTEQERVSVAYEKSTVEQLLANANIEVASLTMKSDGLQQNNQEKQELIHELHRQAQQIQDNLEHYRTASLEQRLVDQQRYEQHQKQLEQTIHQMNQELGQLRQEKILLQQKQTHVIAENNNLNKQLNKLETQQEAHLARISELVGELAKQTQEGRQWQEQFQALRTQYDEKNSILIDIKTNYALLQQQSEAIKHEYHEVRDQNKLLAHEKWMLGQEKSQLYGQLKQLESSMKA